MLLAKPHITHKRSHDEAGFSLVEVLIAVAVFAIGAMAAALMLSNAIRYSASARLITEATGVAQHKLENLLNAPYHDPGLDPASNPHGPVAVGDYQIRWKIEQDVPMSNMKTIRMIVSWSDHGEQKQFTVDALRQ